MIVKGLVRIAVVVVFWTAVVKGLEMLFRNVLAEEHLLMQALGHPKNELLGALICFTLLVMLLKFAVKSKVNPSLAERRAEIERELAEAKRLKQEALAKHAEYEKRLEGLDAEIARIRADIVATGEAERDRAVAEAKEKAERMARDANFLIEQQLKQLRIDLTREAAMAAINGAEKLLREGTASADQERLAKGYLARLDDVAADGGQG